MVDKNGDNVVIDTEHFRAAIFGSARIKDGDPAYQEVYLLAHRLAELGIDVVTGGGPGLMEAANRGHKVGRKNGSKAHSVGLNILLPKEQQANRFLDIKREFDIFSKRLDAFMLLSHVIVVAPGGVGTMLEFFYAWQLMQVKHACQMPIILMGEMWRGLLQWIRENPLKMKLLDKEDLNTLLCVHSWQKAAELTEHAYQLYKQKGREACMNLKSYADKLNVKDIF